MKLVNIEDLKSSAEKLQSSSLWSSTTTEEWRDVVSFPTLFEVSNLGNFRRKGKDINLKQHTTKKGYNSVSTKPSGRNAIAKCFRIHREVALAFIPNIENSPQVNHKNGIKTDNKADNLEWCTAKENMIHARDTNLLNIISGPAHSRYRLTPEFIQNIYDEVAHTKQSLRSVCRKYNVTHTSVLRRQKTRP